MYSKNNNYYIIIILLLVCCIFLSCKINWLETHYNTVVAENHFYQGYSSGLKQQLEDVICSHDTISNTHISTEDTELTESANNNVEVKYPDVDTTNLPMSSELISFTKEAAKYYGYEPDTIFKLIYRESSFNPNAGSNGNYIGLMQISKKYGVSYQVNNDKYDNYFTNGFDLTNPKQNIIIGLRMLDYWRNATETHNNLIGNLCHYNAGFHYNNTDYGTWVLEADLNNINFSNTPVVK